jgi:hypothetical protein
LEQQDHRAENYEDQQQTKTYPIMVLETDCSAMVKALMMQGVHRSRLKFIIEEAREAGSGLSDWTVVHTRRESNGVAHELAQLAKRNQHSAMWRFLALLYVEQLVASNVMHFLSNKALFSSKKKLLKKRISLKTLELGR